MFEIAPIALTFIDDTHPAFTDGARDPISTNAFRRRGVLHGAGRSSGADHGLAFFILVKQAEHSIPDFGVIFRRLLNKGTPVGGGLIKRGLEQIEYFALNFW